MNAEEFNALPLEARQFIEANAGCLACGGKERKLTEAYTLYLTLKKMKAFQIMGGGVNFVEKGNNGVLYPIRDADTDDEIREKIRIAKIIHETNPELFISFDESEIKKTLESLEPAKVVKILDTKKEDDGVKNTASTGKVNPPKTGGTGGQKLTPAQKGAQTKALKAEKAKKEADEAAAKAAADAKAKAETAEAPNQNTETGSDGNDLM